ncbi:beta-ketoacyl-[acyl-carrier-protein] synthase family protein [Ancylobacter dichloromethanicus]|uniref:Nodulation protein E n=1 Tax=Ancylobacter dichloromethanicus TaxID=518825 RepID=A0A9W6JAT3_9HYPH|nr:beta-ketoacyl-[acyl-carrier-protein] synthase family protein [Ancylobacter dichloromethanicus]MBS7552335.1 beta-ketoacyl-[acyl-carrier-protein] synthase family protein [Ancylobacter dichloromethanicus]GLK74071.1 3-oxoacyl-ACP synthase II [Ancylobacter dichloromethanicus]
MPDRPTQARPRVAVTGLGSLSALGNDVAAHLKGLRAGTVGIGETRGVDVSSMKTKISAEVRDFVPEAHFEPRQLGLLDRTAQFAVVAARQALADAGPVLEGAARHRVGAIFAASVGSHAVDDSYRKLYAEGAPRPHPFTVPRAMPSGQVSHITMDLGIHGPAFAIASACSSAAHAIGTAFHMVRSGMLDVAISGGAESQLTYGMLKSWEALRVLSPDGCRPFSRDRAGLVIGEGAGAVVLENMDRALARGATIHAELVGFGMSADGMDITAPDMASAAAAMRFALEDAGLAPEQVDYVSAHGTATTLNDRTEAGALRLVFGDHLARLPVSSSKSQYGHTMNASGALDFVTTVLALREGFLPPTMGFREFDPDCDLDCVPNGARDAAIEAAISSSFAFGGLNAVLAVKRYG